jgi:hypothetical protein
MQIFFWCIDRIVFSVWLIVMNCGVQRIDVDAKEIIHQVNKDWNKKPINSVGRVESGFLTLEGNDTMKDKDGKSW